MSTEEQETRASGSVPHAYGNALAWKWTRDMPVPLRRGFLTVLYALRAMANASGELRFHGDRKAIRIQDIAKAAGADEKDTRRYLDAAEKAGVVAVVGERRRGKSTLYCLIVSPRPDWSAAVAHLDGTKRERPTRHAAPWADEAGEKFGGRSPELEEPKFGGPPPELTAGTENEVRGTTPRWSSGDHPPNGSGDHPPNNPGNTHVSPQERAEVGFQPQVVGAPEPQNDHQGQDKLARCTECRRPIAPDPKRPGRTIHTRCQDRAERNAS
ncbi:hypothetical protein [Streptomyces sp. NPDC020607]|uniref:hypothetical protein n=1 Tax=Streptomyces sp. NPDC020607 TaxID=3365082 RepID=UPI0037A43BBD